MASFLVTGGAGFIGSNIVKTLLDRGERVRVLDDFSTGKRENIQSVQDRIDLVEGTICDPDAVRSAVADMDYVLHQAALPSVPRSVASPIENLQVGVIGTAQVLLAARDARIKRVVYAASSSAYGDQEAERKTECLLPRPLSPYASAKLTGEQLCAVFTNCYGLETISLRYFNVFGPFQDPNSEYSAVIPRFIMAALENRQPVFYGDGLQTRDFTYVENNVEANIAAALSGKGSGMVFNIACGNAYSLHDVLRAINQALGSHIEARIEPPRIGDVRHSMADISLAKEILGYRVLVSFDEGVRRTVQWYKTKSNTPAARETQTTG